MRRRACRRLVAVSLLLVATALTTLWAQPGRRVADRLTIVSLGFDDQRIGAAITAERARLAAVCGAEWTPEGETCLSRNLRPRRQRFAALYPHPDEAASPVGYLVLSLIVMAHPAQQLGLGMDVEWARRPGVDHRWIANLGDWGYGYHIDGDAVDAGAWMRLVGPPPLRSVWLPKKGENLHVFVASPIGHVVRLERVPARQVDGGAAITVVGAFTITRIVGDEVDFRAELPSDMPCAPEEPDAVPAPAVPPPPILRAPASAFFDAAGRPRFSTVYTRGC